MTTQAIIDTGCASLSSVAKFAFAKSNVQAEISNEIAKD